MNPAQGFSGRAGSPGRHAGSRPVRRRAPPGRLPQHQWEKTDRALADQTRHHLISGQRAGGQAVSWCASYIPSGPRLIAATPVRHTSTRPSGFMIAMNCSILDIRPVISKMKCSVLASITWARKASARRSASTRDSPVPLTLTIASSRSSGLSYPRSAASTLRSTPDAPVRFAQADA